MNKEVERLVKLCNEHGVNCLKLDDIYLINNKEFVSAVSGRVSSDRYDDATELIRVMFKQ